MAAATATPMPTYTSTSTSNLDGMEERTSLDLAEIRLPYNTLPQMEDNTNGASRVPRPRRSNGGVDMKKMRADGMDDLAICASPASAIAHKRRRKNSKTSTSRDGSQSLAGMLRRGIVDHQLGLSLNLILLVGMSWCLFPSLRNKLDALFLPSYKTAQEGMYGQGPRDLYLVAAFVVFFTGVRAFVLDYALMPLARLLGVRQRKGRVRFAEQGYLLLYYILYWTWGVFIFVQDTPSSILPTRNTDSTFSTILISLWTHFPRLLIDAPMKIYYLSQLAFWVQQILVIHLEEKRKDHYQMLTHHFVTVALMSTSYGYRQWRVGNAVLVCMDIVDLIFPTAKILKYLGYQKACDAAFALFVVLWLAARHAAYLSICWSIYAHVNEVTMPYGTYSLRQLVPGSSNSGLQLSPNGGEVAWKNIFQPFVNPSAETVAFNPQIRWGFLGLLLGLQCITLMWFIMICRVIVRVLRGQGADDTRSDDECEEDEADSGIDDELDDGYGPVQPSAGVPFTLSSSEEKSSQRRFIEIEAEASELNYAAYAGPRRTGSGSQRTKSKGFTSGLHLGDRKEILNRIGCLSEEQLAREREKKSERRPRSR